MAQAGLRSRWPRWPVILSLVGVVVAGGAAAVAKWPHVWWWLIPATAVIAAVMVPALAVLSQGLQQRLEIGRTARAGLQGVTGTVGSKLPIAGAADLEARVHQTVLPVPYIHRDQEDTISAYLRARRPVLLIGSSMVGKTKMAARIIAEEFSSWPVAVPDSKSALADLDAKDVVLQGSVIWLDDIDRLIGTGGITDGALRRLAAAGNIIIGTIRAKAYDQFRPSSELRPAEWDVLSVFEHVFVSRNLTPKEQERLAVAVDDREIRDRIRTVGLGEYVGAAGQIAEALKLGAAGTDPLGYALILGAADWRLCGMTRPVPSSALAALAGPHMDRRNQARLADQDAFKAGLDWATRDINPNVSLLQLAGPGSYIVYDYVLDLLSAQATPIPNASWSIIMAEADIPELMTLGYNAYAMHHQIEAATQAWRKAACSGHTDQAPIAAFNLGVLLGAEGDVDAAKAAYQRAIDSGHHDSAPRAAIGLGLLLEAEGDIDAAKAAYQRAIDSGHHDSVPIAVAVLGLLLEAEGDIEGAKAAYQRAIDSEHADQAPMATAYLGKLLNAQGDVDGATTAYQRAIDSGHADAAPIAAVYLGLLLKAAGDVYGAKAAYQRAIDSGHAGVAPIATVNLWNLLKAEEER